MSEACEIPWNPEYPMMLALNFPDYIKEIRELDMKRPITRKKIYVVECFLKDGRTITFNGETHRAHISPDMGNPNDRPTDTEE